MDFLSDFILQAVSSPWIYVVMLTVAVIDGFFPPVPSETVLVAAAAVAASAGGADLLLLGTVAAVGAATGDNVAFGIGRRTGTGRFAWMRRPRVTTALARARSALDRRGAGLILGARFVPVGRVAVNLSAGALAYPWPRFAALSVVAGGCWAAYSVAIGMLAGSWLRDRPLVGAVLGVVVAAAVGLVIDRVVAARGRATAPCAPSPATERMTP